MQNAYIVLRPKGKRRGKIYKSLEELSSGQADNYYPKRTIATTVITRGWHVYMCF